MPPDNDNRKEWKSYEAAIRVAPQAHRIRSFLCDGCNHVHIVLFDEADHVIAHGTVSDTILMGIIDLHEVAQHWTLR